MKLFVGVETEDKGVWADILEIPFADDERLGPGILASQIRLLL